MSIDLLAKRLSSEITLHLLALFHRNPGLIDTMDGVARRIGMTSQSIEADVKGLLDLGLLVMKKVGKSEVIYLDRAKDRETQEILLTRLKETR